jgi:cytochrome c oxidase subunit II
MVEPAVTRRRRALAAKVSLVCAAIVGLAACSGASPSAVHPKGSESHEIAKVWWLMFGLAVFVYVVVAALIVFSIVRGRRKEVAPSRLRENTFIWLGGVVVPAVILLVLGVVTVTSSNAIRQPSRNALVIDVAGSQWWWSVRYPAERIVTANEIHVPVGQPLDIRLTTDDVIHSFWVPQLAGKVDTIPGQVNHLRVTVDHTGDYIGLCAEFCGLQHAHMGFDVVAESPGDFGRWVARNQRPAPEPTSDLVERGEVVFTSSACAGCHTIDGTTAHGTRGPDLTHVGTRETLGARIVHNTPGEMKRWIEDAGSIKPGVKMPPAFLSNDQVEALVAYLESRK